MKKSIIIIAALCLCTLLPMSAQQRTEEEYLTRYSLLNGRVGPAGLGMETLISNWETDYPESKSLLLAKFSYHFTKSQSTDIVALDQSKFMGNSPVFSLKDTLNGKNVNYFQVVNYDDESFSIATQAIDRAIKLFPLDIDLRLSKVSALVSYEKESPDMALAYLSSLVDYDSSSSPKWKYDGEEISRDDFLGLVQDYCSVFFRIASPVSMEAFKNISEKLSSLYPKRSEFISNVGSYYFVYKQDYKTAQKYYAKSLKVNPDDYSAIKNSVLLGRKTKNIKLEMKYLPMLERVSTDPAEKAAAKARLEGLKK